MQEVGYERVRVFGLRRAHARWGLEIAFRCGGRGVPKKTWQILVSSHLIVPTQEYNILYT